MLWPWESTSVPFCSLDLKVSSTLASLNVCPIPTAENKRFPQTAPTCPRLFTIYTEAVLFVHVLWASLSHIWTQVLWWRTAARKTPFAWCLWNELGKAEILGLFVVWHTHDKDRSLTVGFCSERLCGNTLTHTTLKKRTYKDLMNLQNIQLASSKLFLHICILVYFYFFFVD